MFLREFRLQAAPATAVTGDDDPAFDAHAQLFERVVILLHSVVDVDELGLDVAIALINEIGGKRGVFRHGAGIAFDGFLLQRRLERFAPEQFERFVNRGGVEHIERLDMRVPTPRLELGEYPFGIRLVVRRTDMVGLRGQRLHPAAQFVRVDSRVEFFLECGLVVRSGFAGLRTERCHGAQNGGHGEESRAMHIGLYP